MTTTESRSTDEPQLPRRFGRYTLFDFIGKGGMAEIYLARAHTELGAVRLAVVKQILEPYAAQQEFATMLTHEAKLAARLSNRHIVQVFDLGREADRLYIAMEYVEGLDLNQLLRKCREHSVKLPFEYALSIVTSVLSALDYAHRQTNEDGTPAGIVHRDISPSNILVSFDGEVKLCDFGIAKANSVVTGVSIEESEVIKGKAGYMSPEHARGEPLDQRADVFATGILLWELVSGRRMYRPSSDVPLLDQARAADIPDLPKRDLPAETMLHGIIKKALAVNAAERFATARLMLGELEDYMSVAGFSPSELGLGEWMTAEFSEEVIEQRRAREQALAARSLPPPPDPNAASSAQGNQTVSATAPSDPPPSSDRDNARPAPRTGQDLRTSVGAARAFRAGLEDAASEIPAPNSLVAATVDLGPPSRPELAADPKPKRRTPAFAIALVVLGLVLVAYLLARRP